MSIIPTNIPFEVSRETLLEALVGKQVEVAFHETWNAQGVNTVVRGLLVKVNLEGQFIEVSEPGTEGGSGPTIIFFESIRKVREIAA
jgi:hypothetical protein